MNAAQTSSYSYLIIGSGRLARHLSHYFQSLGLKYSNWDRRSDQTDLEQKSQGASHILLAISDSAIEAFYQEHQSRLENKTVVHFSGALNIKDLISAHPLMTFGFELYDLPSYEKIHFMLTGCESLEEALPGLNNPFSIVFAFEKPRYHALCVLGGNFTNLLVAKMLEGFAEMKIPASAAKPYIEKIIENVLKHPEESLTGPLARKDANTVEKNLQSLNEDPYQAIYKAFLEALWPDYPKK